MTTEKKSLTVREAADMLSVEPEDIEAAIDRGDLPVLRVGTDVRTSTMALRRWFESWPDARDPA